MKMHKSLGILAVVGGGGLCRITLFSGRERSAGGGQSSPTECKVGL